MRYSAISKETMMKKFGIFSVVLPLLCISCASIMSGSTQSININTEPTQARVTIYDGSNAKVWDSTTPATVQLKRGNGYFTGALYRVEISKPGFQSQVLQLSSSLNTGWYLLGNFFLGGLIGWLIVDPITGAMWTVRPEDINAQLNRVSSYNKYDNSLSIVLREDIPDGVFDSLPKLRLN
jgi:hypothetical protein